jgi:hypothetical protein
MSYLNIADYLNSNVFVVHPMGNYGLYGLNFFGCNSVIRYGDEIMKFYAFKSGTNNAIYINKSGREIIINPYDTDSTVKINRLIDIKDLEKSRESIV